MVCDPISYIPSNSSIGLLRVVPFLSYRPIKCIPSPNTTPPHAGDTASAAAAFEVVGFGAPVSVVPVAADPEPVVDDPEPEGDDPVVVTCGPLELGT